MSAVPDGFLSRPRMIWIRNREAEAYLVELLIERHKNMGRTAYNERKSDVIHFVKCLMNSKFRLNLDENQIEIRCILMKICYGIVKTMLSRREFSWDDTRHMVVADDKAWDNYIMARPEARPFRLKSFPLYKQMSILFEEETGIPEGYVPNGVLATAEGNSNTETTPNSSEPYNLPTQLISINDKPTKKRKIVNSAESVPKRRAHLKFGETIENTFYEVSTEAKAKAKQRNALSSTTLYKNCLEELQDLEELDDNEFAKAVNALKDDKNAIAFMTIKGPRRLTWLRSLWLSK